MKNRVSRIMALLLVGCFVLSFIQPVSATNTSVDAFEANNAYLEDTDIGLFFVMMNDSKCVTIHADESTHFLAVAIKYLADPYTVYEWLIRDYPDEDFQTNEFAFWTSIMEYAEARLGDANVITFSYEDVDPNIPATISSAGADLRAQLISLLGDDEYTNRYIRSEVMDGIRFNMYETLEFSIYKVKTFSWADAMSVASLLSGVLGLIVNNPNAEFILGVLSVATSITGDILETVVPAGKVNCYACDAHYVRYITMDGGTHRYSQAYKIISYEGYENADDGSSERAEIRPKSKSTKYSHAADYFNTGLFDAAYTAYKTGG